eukprot:TRINITY_DN61617_c0_g1_i1.p1 TRINITY_DN61617_c0_g1~~TRINITY_DN61617_c0_g1_i1.p1  ORF type:complete len:1386 (+),score=166.87 TRINITY_DN61617_c0_g1_i1:582-4160(+)
MQASASCVVDGQVIAHDTTVTVGCRGSCTCNNGQSTCVPCPNSPFFCQSNQIQETDSCGCIVCRTANNCNVNGQAIAHGSTVDTPNCGGLCSCNDGRANCLPPCLPRDQVVCPSGQKVERDPNEICECYTCVQDASQPCDLGGGMIIGHGETAEAPNCQGICTCNNGVPNCLPVCNVFFCIPPMKLVPDPSSTCGCSICQQPVDCDMGLGVVIRDGEVGDAPNCGGRNCLCTDGAVTCNPQCATPQCQDGEIEAADPSSNCACTICIPAPVDNSCRRDRNCREAFGAAGRCQCGTCTSYSQEGEGCLVTDDECTDVACDDDLVCSQDGKCEKPAPGSCSSDSDCSTAGGDIIGRCQCGICGTYKLAGESCNGSLPPCFNAICADGLRCALDNPGQLGGGGTCVPQDQCTSDSDCKGGEFGRCQCGQCVRYGEQGDSCNASLPPCDNTLCGDGLKCEVQDITLLGADGKCIPKDSCLLPTGKTLAGGRSKVLCEEDLACECSKEGFLLCLPACPLILCEPGYLPVTDPDSKCGCMKCEIIKSSECVSGLYLNSDSVCMACPAGSFCVGGVAGPEKCGRGEYQDETGSSACKFCPPGSVCSGRGLAQPTEPCPVNHYCPEGSSKPKPCPTNLDGIPRDDVTGLRQQADCEVEDSMCYSVVIEYSWQQASNQAFGRERISPTLISVHADDFQFFKLGERPSRGLEIFAELGLPDELRDEMPPNYKMVPGQGPPYPPATVLHDICLFKEEQIDIMAVLQPSPDWFVFASAKPWGNRRWQDKITYTLGPDNQYDAGGDSGRGFLSSDKPAGDVVKRYADAANLFELTAPIGKWTLIRKNAKIDDECVIDVVAPVVECRKSLKLKLNKGKGGAPAGVQIPQSLEDIVQKGDDDNLLLSDNCAKNAQLQFSLKRSDEMDVDSFGCQDLETEDLSLIAMFTDMDANTAMCTVKVNLQDGDAVCVPEEPTPPTPPPPTDDDDDECAGKCNKKCDKEAPVLNCKKGHSVKLSKKGRKALPTTALLNRKNPLTDNCDEIDDVKLEVKRTDRLCSTSVTCADARLPNITVVLTATDAAGNEATCEVDVTVVGGKNCEFQGCAADDTVAPVVDCLSEKSIKLGSSGSVKRFRQKTLVGKEGVQDECSSEKELSFFTSIGSLGCKDVKKGPAEYCLEFMDEAGNVAECVTTVEAQDNKKACVEDEA